jgi:hypothetical protein
MEATTLIYAIAAALSGLSAVLAWLAKLKWSKEYIAAKDEIIRAKEAQIKQLQDMTPMKIEEYFHSVVRQLEANIDFLKRQLSEAETKSKESVSGLNDQIDILQEELTKTKSISKEVSLWSSASLFLHNADAFFQGPDGSITVIEAKSFKKGNMRMTPLDVINRVEELVKPDTNVEVWIWARLTGAARMIEGRALAGAISSIAEEEEVIGVIHYRGHDHPVSEVFTKDPRGSVIFQEIFNKVSKRQSELRAKYGN